MHAYILKYIRSKTVGMTARLNDNKKALYGAEI
jgi:hypothetical protein